MKVDIEKRVLQEALYITKNNSTIRDTAKVFNISKSTVHKDLNNRLHKINKSLYLEVRKILDNNMECRHIRGGIATQNKYLSMKEGIYYEKI